MNGPDYVANAIAKAHANDIKVNLFYSDDPEEAVRYLEMGVDTILSNDYQRVAAAVDAWKNK
jgi:glycerophosphoryl diester phosphodiesterase